MLVGKKEEAVGKPAEELAEEPAEGSNLSVKSSASAESPEVESRSAAPKSFPPLPPPIPAAVTSLEGTVSENPVSETAENASFPSTVSGTLSLEDDELGSGAENEEDSPFLFEEPSSQFWNPKTLVLGVLAVAAGVFLLGVVIFLVFSSTPAKPTMALKVPPRMQEFEEKSEISEETSEEETEAETEAETEEETEEEKPVSRTSDAGSDELEAETEEPKKEPQSDSDSEPAENAAPADGDLSSLMQSSLGKQLSGNLPPAGETSDLEGNAVSETESVPPETPSQTDSEADETEKVEKTAENSENSVQKSSSTPSADDPDALVFSRRKRQKVYAGEDPVLNFDASTRPADLPANSGPAPKTSIESEASDAAETSVNVPTPTDETVTEAPQLPRMKVFRVVPPQNDSLPAQSARNLAIPLESVSITGKPVTALTQFAAQMSGERIVADWKKLGTIGASMNAPLTLTLEGTSVREALETGLYSVGLGVISVGNSLRLVGWDAAAIVRAAAERGEKPVKRTLELEDLASTYATEASGQSGLGELARMIPTFVHPAVWEGANGPGRLVPNAAKSRITLQQFSSVIQEAELFCDKIRHARNMELKSLPTNPNQLRNSLQDGTEIFDAEIIPRYELSEKVRRTPISCDLSDGTTLRSALIEIMRCAGARLVIDEAAVARVPITNVVKDANVPDFEGNRPKLPDSILDLPCVYRFEEIPMEEAVGDALKTTPLFCYPVSQNLFFLTTFDEAQRKMLVDFYPAGDLIQNSTAAGTVLNGICSTIQPKSWTRSGGAGSIYFDAPSKALIVRQNPYVLHQIEQFLKRFRETKNPDARMEATHD